MVAVSLLISQRLFSPGDRRSTAGSRSIRSSGIRPITWSCCRNRVKVRIEGRDVWIQAWKYRRFTARPATNLPVYFLDTDLPENHEWDRGITYHLYGGDEIYRFKQEVVLGIGGVRMLQELGINVKKYHMNEGHAALLTLELLHALQARHRKQCGTRAQSGTKSRCRDLCIFTTHTPVEAGHDKFSYDIVTTSAGRLFSARCAAGTGRRGQTEHDDAGPQSQRISQRRGEKAREVSQNMFPGYNIRAITNGVHTRTWTHPMYWPKLYDEYIPDWRDEPEFSCAWITFPTSESGKRIRQCKRELLAEVRTRTGIEMRPGRFHHRFRAPRHALQARRFVVPRYAATGRNRRRQIADYLCRQSASARWRRQGTDSPTSSKARSDLAGEIKVVYLQNYEMELALQARRGRGCVAQHADASARSVRHFGMKATHNGVPNFSRARRLVDRRLGRRCDRLEHRPGTRSKPSWSKTTKAPTSKTCITSSKTCCCRFIMPMTTTPAGFKVMKGAIGKNACYFNTHRMMRQYVTEAYIR